MAKVKSKKTQVKTQKRSQPQANVKPQQARSTRKRRNGNMKRTVDPYVVCRLNPFASKGSTGIPDGMQIRKLVVDHRQTNTITFGSTGSVGIMFTPALPSCVWVRHYDATTIVNGVPTTTNFGFGTLIPIPTAEWAGQPLTYLNAAGQFDDVTPLYSAAKARIVSGAWQIMYLGTSLTDSGMIRANVGSFTVDTPIPNVGNFTVSNWAGAGTTTYATSQVFVRPVTAVVNDTSFASSANTYDTTIGRLSRGAHGLLKHSGKDYEFKEVYPNVTYLARQGVETSSLLLNQSTTPLTVGVSAVCQFFDNDWDTTFISVTGGTPGQSFAIDSVLCVEYAPMPTSSVYALAKHGRTNLPALKAADAGVDKMPTSSPGSFPSMIANTASTLSTIVEVASAVGTLIV